MFYRPVRGIIGADKAGAERTEAVTNEMRETEIRYYSDERTEEFSGITRKTVTIDGSYRYLHKNPIWKQAFCTN